MLHLQPSETTQCLQDILNVKIVSIDFGLAQKIGTKKEYQVDKKKGFSFNTCYNLSYLQHTPAHCSLHQSTHIMAPRHHVVAILKLLYTIYLIGLLDTCTGIIG